MPTKAWTEETLEQFPATYYDPDADFFDSKGVVRDLTDLLVKDHQVKRYTVDALANLGATPEQLATNLFTFSNEEVVEWFQQLLNTGATGPVQRALQPTGLVLCSGSAMRDFIEPSEDGEEPTRYTKRVTVRVVSKNPQTVRALFFAPKVERRLKTGVRERADATMIAGRIGALKQYALEDYPKEITQAYANGWMLGSGQPQETEDEPEDES